MLKNFRDLKKFAEEAIRIEYFATMDEDLTTVKTNQPIIEVLAEMKANDFDIVPVIQGQKILGYVEKNYLESFSKTHEFIGDITDIPKMSQAKVIDLNNPESNSLEKAFKYLYCHRWFFVKRDKTIVGIVTLDDLKKSIVSLYVLSKLLMVEAGLRRLWGTYTNTPTPDTSIDKDESFWTIIEDVKTQYHDNNEKIIKNLGYTFDSFNDLTKDIMLKLRNTIAHGGSVLSFANEKEKGIEEVIECIWEIDKLLEAITKLTQNRDQVWKAFEKSYIFTKGQVKEYWVGVNTVDLPKNLQLPVYVISAENPSEEVLSEEKNKVRTKAIRDVLNYRKFKSSNRKWEYTEVVGQSPDERWNQDSFAVGGINKEEACKLAKMFGQRAVFELTQDYIRVIPTDPKEEDSRKVEKLHRNVNLRIRLAKDNR